MIFLKYAFNIVMCQDTDIGELICCKFGMMLHTAKLQFDSSFNDFDVHLRSQGYRKSRTCAVSLL